MAAAAITRHWRLPVSAAIGVGAGMAAPWVHAPPAGHLLLGWVAGAAAYVALLWRLFLADDEGDLRRRAAAEDENKGVMLIIVLALVAASLVAIVAALVDAHRPGVSQGEKGWIAALAGLTLVVSWVMLQSVFVLHYAHRHFGDRDADGEIDGGFKFPGEPAKTYMDFVYLSFCIGATFQVSDTNVETARLRNLITAHAAICYFYNTAILALGINIIAGVVSG